MDDSDNPGSRRKARAGVVVVMIVLLIALAIFVGMNFQHAEELEEQENTSQSR